MSLATALNWLLNVLVSATFLTLTSWLSLSGVFSSYALTCAAAAFFAFAFVPETKNKSLEDISKELKSK